MDLNNRDLALQASRLAGGLLMGLGGLLLDLFPPFPMPPQLDISLAGTLAILMIGGGLSGMVRDCRDWCGLTFRDTVHEDSTSAADLRRVETGFQTAASGRPMPLDALVVWLTARPGP